MAPPCVEGAVIPNAVIELTKEGGDRQQPYLKLELTNVMISSCQLAATEDGSAALQVTMSFEKLTQTYSAQNADGSVSPQNVFSVRNRFN